MPPAKKRRTSGGPVREYGQGTLSSHFGLQASQGGATGAEGTQEGAEHIAELSITADEPDGDGDEETAPPWAGMDPYYQRVFDEALDTVLEHESHLFDSGDLALIQRYKNAGADGQKLLVRLFSRSWKWLRLSSLSKYTEIDLPCAYASLCSSGFADEEPSSLSELLNLMSSPELKALAKQTQLVTTLQSRWTKPEYIDAIIAHTATQTLLIGDPVERTKTRVKKILGPILRLDQTAGDLFERTMMLYFRSLDLIERPMVAGILSLVERWTFPEYEVKRFPNMFPTREASVEYYQALQLHARIEKLVERKKVEDCLEHLDEIQAMWESLLMAADADAFSTERKSYFLIQFTPVRVFTMLLTNFALNILPSVKLYDRATTIIHMLLSQQHYGWGSRGKWWDQLSHLTLNYSDAVQEREERALEFCVEAVRDPLVRAGWLVRVRRRLERVAKKLWERKQMESQDGLKSKKGSKKLLAIISGWEALIPGDIRHRLIDRTIREPGLEVCEGVRIDHRELGRKSTWLVEGEDLDVDDDAETANGEDGDPQSNETETSQEITVEEVAMRHYAKQGYNGLHVENALFHHIFGLLFYEVLYATSPQCPHVFQTRYQTHPLDFFTDEFYMGREPAISARCHEIETARIDDLVADCAAMDIALRDRRVKGVGLAWDAMTHDQFVEILSCVQVPALGTVMRRMAEAYRDHCGGLPDLVLWDATTSPKRIKLVEVKGPGDRLSEKQIMWMDILGCCGWDIDVCKVEEKAKKTLPIPVKKVAKRAARKRK
ncbi:Fanconi-associated nuclease 1 [Geranomyces variabilis]|uniref:Fanconi-associated nuclease n=1 Tax=Geranomyces variabilis TaxID=109894 RepID=A0AAD5TKL3_9FUNG|nr:Fanconi-associated nuclease 1 [Geranomyces variabilis]